MRLRAIPIVSAATFLASVAFAQDNSDQPAIDACIDALMASDMSSAPGGTVLNSSFSEAGTEVIFEDGGGVAWRCIAYKDGSVGLLEEATAEQAEAARSAPDISDWQEQVSFDPGTSGTTLTRTMEAGGAFQFLLGAREGQFLRVSVTPQEGRMRYTIYNPDGSLLLEGTDASEEYNGQLPQSGDYMVEVVSKESVDVTYEISFEIE